VARDNAKTAQIQAIDAHLTQMDNEPMWVIKFLGNRYVQLGLAGLGTFITTSLAK